MDVLKSICLLLVSLPLVIEAADWDYGDGAKGPANWKDINPKCGGMVQSPIDYTCHNITYGETLGSLTLEGYGNPTTGSNVTLLNNGHTLQVGLYDRHAHNMSGGSLPGTFTFAQLHFHWGNSNTEGSEHFVDGTAYPLELHFVHYNTKYNNLSVAVPEKDGLAVLGVFFKIDSADNAALKPILDHASKIENKGDTTIPQFNLRKLMPGNIAEFYRNNGSLTTPPCDESVTWTVFKNVLTVSEKQLEMFRKLKDAAGNKILKNYRPIQKLNGRKIMATFAAGTCPPPTTKPSVVGPTAGTQSLGASFFTGVLIAFAILIVSH